MIIREAKSLDASSVTRVDFESYYSTYSGIMPEEYLKSRTFEQRLSVWKSRLSVPSTLWPEWFVYVAEGEDKKVIGFAGGGPQHSGYPICSGELGFIYLLKSHQRQGIGRRLMATIAVRLKQQGHVSMQLWALEANPFRSFYEVLGGRKIAERTMNFGGKDLVEIAYGWHDLGIFDNILHL